MISKLGKSLLVAAVLVGLSACGLSPQQVHPEPRLEGRYPVVAQGQQVQLALRDSRPSPVLGNRGGVYANNPLTAESQAVLPRLQSEMEAGLRLQGFQPALAASRVLDIQLSKLSYQVAEGRTAFGEVNLEAVLQVHLRKEGANYRAEYVARLNKGFVKAPSVEANNQLVGQVLADVMQRLFEDQAAMAFLAR